MKIIAPIIIITILLLLNGCKPSMTEDEIASLGIQPCKTMAAFIKPLGFNPERTGYNTTRTDIKGLILMEFPTNPNDTNYKKYQHPSWTKFGWFGSITTDDLGNSYVAPLPVINTLDNPLSTINRVLKVNSTNGELAPFCELPKVDSVEGVVPFGVLGLHFDCHAKKIYASSVAGSTRDVEKGVLYCINQTTGKIEDKYKGMDAMGLCIAGITGTKKLYFGSARNSNIYSLELSKEGDFIGKPQLEFSLDQLGSRGDDKARKIKLNSSGNLLVSGVTFNYSLAAQNDAFETIYEFVYDGENKKWLLVKK